MIRSLPFRAAVLAALALAALATALALAIGWQANRALSERTLAELRKTIVSLGLDNVDNATIETRVRQQIDAVGRDRDLQPFVTWHWHLADASGRTLVSTFQPDTHPALIANAAAANGAVVMPYAWRDAQRLAVFIASRIGDPPLTLLVARDIEDERALARRIQLLAIAGLVALAAAALALGVLARRHLLARIAAISTTAQSIVAGDLKRRIPRDHADDEFDHLAGQLNAMLTRIDDLMQALREVSDNIAHDLKTPINRLRNTAEAALSQPPASQHEALGAVIEQSDQIIQTFNALLQIARLEQGSADLTRETVDLGQLALDVVELYEPVVEDYNLIIRLLENPPTPYFGNKQLLGQAVANLLDNAMKYSSDLSLPYQRAVDLRVRTTDDHIEIIVADMGPGIAARDRDAALKRFGRLDKSRSLPGTGLGLSLVAAIARLHGGTLTLADHQPANTANPGLKVTLSLPRRAA